MTALAFIVAAIVGGCLLFLSMVKAGFTVLAVAADDEIAGVVELGAGDVVDGVGVVGLLLTAWCFSQCSRANACLCLFVQGFGFFNVGFFLPRILLGRQFLALGLKNISRASRSRYFSASVGGLNDRAEEWLR